MLEVLGLSTELVSDEGRARVVDDVSFTIEAGATLGLVGESGCGKSVTALSLLRLIQDPPGRIVAGRVLLEGEDLLTLPEAALGQVRGAKIAIIFQEPMTSLNPVMPVGEQIAESIRLHRKLNRASAIARAIELLAQLGIGDPTSAVNAYPHQLSGGMRQRVLIAVALACDPKVLIADEPTTALDVTLQAQILDLLARLQRERNLGVLLITHDLGVVAQSCKTVAVMYAGRIVEHSDVETLFFRPAHPYTAALLRSFPRPEQVGARLEVIPGRVPSLARLPPGCRFRDRCPRAVEICAVSDPPLEIEKEGRLVACHNPVPAGAVV